MLSGLPIKRAIFSTGHTVDPVVIEDLSDVQIIIKIMKQRFGGGYGMGCSDCNVYHK